MGRALVRASACAVAATAGAASWAGAGPPFATRVIEYAPAPGQFVNDARFNDPSRALGAPVGGGMLSPDNSKVVTLGGFGGTITLGFDRRVLDDPRNPMGLDAIVFGNAAYVAGDPNRRWAEAATIEISLDVNGNGLADDPWYLVVPPQISGPVARVSRTWDDNIGDPTHPPHASSWVPSGRTGQWQTWAYELPVSVFGGPVVLNPLGPLSTAEGVWGVADQTPTLLLGDLTADDVVDVPWMGPEWFYTRPDDPMTVGISSGSGGGDAFDIAWAIDPGTGLPALLPGFDFIRITTAVDVVHPLLGEISAEIGGVAIVRPDLGIRGEALRRGDWP